jgi:RNA polymerase sigma-70 factor (TIGR02943 family)
LEEKKDNNLDPDKWVDRYADDLFRFALSKVGETELAEDLIQETFISGIKGMSNFKGKSSEKTWLISILRNKIIDHYRKRASSKESYNADLSEEYFDENGGWKADSTPGSWKLDFSTEIERTEFRDILGRCMGKLSDTAAAIFAMKNMEGYSSKEICKELNISSSNYWVQMHRSKLQLRTCLENNWIEKR